MLHRTLPFLAAAGALTVGLTGCSGGGSTGSGAAPAAVAPTAEESTVPQTGPAPTKPGASPQAGCPVDAATLEKAFRENPEVSKAIVLGAGLTDVSCVQDYATARTRPDNVDPATVLFHYDGTRKTWLALTGGTDGVCDTDVPKAIRSQLKNCF